MGGIGRIYFSSISEYARRAGLAGGAFDTFVLFLREIDDEYVGWSNEKAKAETEKNKRNGGS